jgi:glycosyltransferase involved in cell wall biosynthesis
MRILLINSYHYLKGGADAVYFNTARLLEQNGHEVFFFSTKDSENIPDKFDNYFADNIDYRKLSFSKKMLAFKSFFYNGAAHNKLLRFISEIKPDLIHIHLFLGGLSSSILTAIRKMDIPVLHSVHDYRMICPAYLFIDGKNKVCEKCVDGFYLHCVINKCSGNSLSQSSVLALDAYFRKYFIKPINYIDRFIFVSRFIKNKHIEFDSEFEAKARVLYNFNPGINSIEPSEEKGNYFLYFGRISREKGIISLIQAASRAKVALKIVGTGPMYEQLKEEKSENVEFLGYKRGEELWSLIRNASFIVVPSEWYENNPLTIVEAYSLGKPVIGAKIGGITEIVEENMTGYLFDPGNISALEKVLLQADRMSTGEYQNMSKHARLFAENNFNPESHYKELIGIYKDVIDNKNHL